MGKTAETKKAKETPGKPPRKSNDPELRLWASFGAESIYFQREAQINFWTALGIGCR